MSARPPGESMPRRTSAMGAAPRASRMFSMVARYSRASSRAREVSAFVSVASPTMTQVASPVPFPAFPRDRLASASEAGGDGPGELLDPSPAGSGPRHHEIGEPQVAERFGASEGFVPGPLDREVGGPDDRGRVATGLLCVL